MHIKSVEILIHRGKKNQVCNLYHFPQPTANSWRGETPLHTIASTQSAFHFSCENI